MTKAIDYMAIQEALIEALRQGECLLENLPSGAYNNKVAMAYNATIGGHYRHSLEHFEALLKIDIYEEINYDVRDRNSAVETNSEYALQRTRLLIKEFSHCCNESWFKRTVPVRCKISYRGDDSPRVSATLAREAMYAVVHAIHHFALIGVMCQMLGISLPAGFGVAPSTAHHRRTQSKKPSSKNSVIAG